jgi:hypothetical protein
VAVIITTPYMDEAARCNRIGFMRQGELIAEGTPSQLRSRLEGRILELRGDRLRDMNRLAARDPGVEDVRLFGDRLHLRTCAGQSVQVSARLQTTIPQAGIKLDSLSPVQAGLEDVFIALAELDQPDKALLELPEPHQRTLRFLLEKIPPDQFGWVLIGSAGLRLQGVDVPVHDLDLECNSADIYRIEKALAGFIKTPVHIWETGRMRSLDGKAEMNGVEVELVAEMEFQNPDGSWKRPKDLERKILVDWQEMQVPVFRLEEEAAAYEAMGRMEKVQLIRETIQKMEEASHD